MAILTFFRRLHFGSLVLKMFSKMTDMVELDISTALVWIIRKDGVSIGKALKLLFMAGIALLVRHCSQVEVGTMMFAMASAAN